LIPLLGRVRAALAADTAAVLLVDERGENLIARAVLGLDDYVPAVVRPAVGKDDRVMLWAGLGSRRAADASAALFSSRSFEDFVAGRTDANVGELCSRR